MIIGTVKEIMDQEYRVGLTPEAVHSIVADGHQVLVEAHAGEGSGFSDQEYVQAGASMVAGAAEVFARSALVVKVKQLLEPEYDHLRSGLIVFTFLHLAVEPELTRVLVEKEVTGIDFATVQLPNRDLPLLTPMSEVAGRLATQVAAHYLCKMCGGSGKLLGGVPGVPPCKVVVIGAGTVGTNAAEIALGMGADLTIIDKDIDRLRHLSGILHGRVKTLASTPTHIAEATRDADVLVGAVLIPGAKAPVLVSREMIRSMKPGSVVVDVCVDQGGCIETIHPTTHSEPTFVVDGVLHYGLPNMPGMVPRTSTHALTNATLPYVLDLANRGFAEAVNADSALARGVNVYRGRITNAAVAEAMGMAFVPLEQLLPGA